jgi:hypothetical protein
MLSGLFFIKFYNIEGYVYIWTSELKCIPPRCNLEKTELGVL